MFADRHQWPEFDRAGTFPPGRRALESCSYREVAGTRVAVVVELLLDVDHVAAGVLQLSELGSAAEVSKIAELGQP
ncbi:hypothetical protein EYF80_034558 [Liparis tanakae]|uniref:Uncharacterized protein n=1 Tax=Liparis tanakae TaxID=230148 RepID=A0A4Z2GQ23_9TELE|nr:hypothetical protein EYF80_034558 [Liparis tanakae]